MSAIHDDIVLPTSVEVQSAQSPVVTVLERLDRHCETEAPFAADHFDPDNAGRKLNNRSLGNIRANVVANHSASPFGRDSRDGRDLIDSKQTGFGRKVSRQVAA